MTQIGVRELRQHASRWLERVQAGESFEVTNNGVPVARLVPIEVGESVLDRLVREGKATRALGSIRDIPAPPERPAGTRPLSEVLDELKEDRI